MWPIRQGTPVCAAVTASSAAVAGHSQPLTAVHSANFLALQRLCLCHTVSLQVFIHRIRKYLGAYLLQLGRVDAIVWSAGIGENSAAVRRDALADLLVRSCCL